MIRKFQFILVLLVLNLMAQSILWEKTFSDLSSIDKCNIDNQGNIYCGGSKPDTISSYNDQMTQKYYKKVNCPTRTKLNKSGEIEWHTVLNTSTSHHIEDIHIVSDDSIVYVYNFFGSSMGSLADIYALSCNSQGESNWCETYKYSLYTSVISSRLGVDNNISFLTTCGHLCKIEPSKGETINNIDLSDINGYYDLYNGERLYDIVEYTNDSYVVVGPEYISIINNESAVAIDGIEITERTFLRKFSNNDLLFSKEDTLIRINSEGAIVWKRVISETVYDIKILVNDNILFCGWATIDNNKQTLYKMNSNGEMLWRNVFEDKCINEFYQMENNDIVCVGASKRETIDTIVAGILEISTEGHIFKLVGDQYAQNDSLFSYQIPNLKSNMSYTFSALKAPDDMEISEQGIILWKPETDSAYVEQIVYLVTDNLENVDTLSLNIIINDTNTSVQDEKNSTSDLYKKSIDVTIEPSQIIFKSDIPFIAFKIYNLQGRMIQNVSLNEPALEFSTSKRTLATGNYIVQIKDGKRTRQKLFKNF